MQHAINLFQIPGNRSPGVRGQHAPKHVDPGSVEEKNTVTVKFAI